MGLARIKFKYGFIPYYLYSLLMKKNFTRISCSYLVAFNVLALFFTKESKAQVVLTNDIQSYTQDFNSLPITGSATWTDGEFYLPGWTVQRTSTSNSLLTGTGSSNTGGLYSFGSSGSSDRAIGAISSGTASVGHFAWGVLIQNNTNATITSLHISFTGEQWRSASRTAGRQATTFWISQSSATTNFSLSPLSDENWTSIPDLDFYSVVYYSAAGALNGNLPANKSFLSSTVPVVIPVGHYIMLRWKDLNDLDDDHGLAVDDFKLSWSSSATPEPGLLPVELISFRALIEGKNVQINWLTASEKNSSYFNVERSSNGLDFEAVGYLPAKGNTNQRTSYSFNDDMPLPALSYYRLRQVDEDGTSSFSATLPIRILGPSVALLHRSIVSDVLQLDMPSSVTSRQFQIYDIKGRIVLTHVVPVLLTNYSLEVGHLQAGHYFLTLSDYNGQRQVLRFTKL